MLSINTNVGSMVALQNLSSTTMRLEETQLRVSTGLRVNNTKEDAATWTIAQRIRGDIAGYEAVQIGMGLGDATLGVALRAGEAISDLLIEMKGKAVQAQGGGLASADRAAINDDVAKLVEQVTTIVSTAEFNGSNLITSTGSDLTVLTTQDGSDFITLSARALDTTSIGIDSLDLSTSATASTALSSINDAISSVNSALAAFGATANQLEVQMNFNSNLIDILTEGVGTLVDADMAQESASLQALQIQQQLGTQALAIANAAPQTILGLFG